MSFSQRSKKQLLLGLFSNASLYGTAVVLPRIGDVIMIPVYWTRLEPADFGIVALAQMAILFLGPLLSLGLFDALQRLYFDWKSEERAENVTAIWLCSVSASLLICMVLDILGRRYSGSVFAQIPYDPYVRVAIWTAFLTNLTLVPYALLRVREQIRKFVGVSTAAFALQTGATVYFVLILNQGAIGLLFGNLVGSGILALYLVWFMLREARLPRRLDGLGGALRYSVPLIPALIVESVGSVFDRFFLDKYVGLQNIGLYNLGRQFGSAFNVLNIAMKYSWFPLIYRTASERDDAPEVLAKLSLYYIALLAIPALGIALLSREIILWLGGERYAAVYQFVPAFVLLYFMNSIGIAMGRGIDLAKKTIYNSVLSPIVLVVNFISMWVLIPRYGVWGAIGGALITMFTRHGVAIVAGFILYPRPFPGRQLLLLAVICAAAFYFGSRVTLPNLAYDFFAQCGILAAATFAIAHFCLDGRRAYAMAREWLDRKFV